MGILIRLAFTLVAGLFTFVTKSVPWLAIAGAICTVGGAIVTAFHVYGEMKKYGWLS